MPSEVFNYVKDQRIGVLAVEMLDGSPHAATVHFAYIENPFVLYFKTSNDTKKTEPLLEKKMTRASYVVGSNEGNMQTLQMDGIASIISPDEHAIFDTTFHGRFPEKVKKEPDPKAVFIKFTPTWWRFTDWTLPKGKTVLISTEYTNKYFKG